VNFVAVLSGVAIAATATRATHLAPVSCRFISCERVIGSAEAQERGRGGVAVAGRAAVATSRSVVRVAFLRQCAGEWRRAGRGEARRGEV
jgi:hypothetical protein